jgi:hypothetical protein
MDWIVLAAATGLVEAVTSETWVQVREAVVGLWRRKHPQEAERIGTELDELHDQVLHSRREGDADTEKSLEIAWQVKLQELLRANPASAMDLRQVLDQFLLPALTRDAQARVQTLIMRGSSYDSSTFTQIGSQTVYNQP